MKHYTKKFNQVIIIWVNLIFLFLVLLISVYITIGISSHLYTYDFTINYVFYNNLDLEQKLWTYLKYREEVINCIIDDKPILTRKCISEENKKEVTFEEFEQVKKVIKNLKIQQLEKILFKYNSSSFNKQAFKDFGIKWGKVFTLSSFISSVFLFFREDIRLLILDQLQQIPALITKINNLAEKFISFLKFQGNISTERGLVIAIPQKINTVSLLELILFYICIFYLLIVLLVIIKEKLAHYFISPRKITIKKYLIPMLEEELKKKKLQEKKFNYIEWKI